jgi:hypothetical protein
MTPEAKRDMTAATNASALDPSVNLIDVIRIGAGRKTFMSPELMRAMGLSIGDRLAFGRLPDGTIIVKKVAF